MPLSRRLTDTWAWGDAAEDTCQSLIVEEGGQIGATIQGLQQFLNETPMMAYLAMMASRIVEMHRLLKDTGALYLHCDSLCKSITSKLFLMLFSEFPNFKTKLFGTIIAFLEIQDDVLHV